MEIGEYDAVIIITPVYDLKKIKKSLSCSQFRAMPNVSLNDLLD